MNGDPRAELLAPSAGEELSEWRKERQRISFADDQGVFMISVAAELAGMHPQTLRVYEARGLIKPSRSPKQTRLYSQRDVERLKRIQELTTELGLNLAGVERVLDARESDGVRCASSSSSCSGEAEADAARDARARSTRCTAPTSASWCRWEPPGEVAADTRRERRSRFPSSERQTASMQPDKFTIKSQEAIQAAQRLAHERAQPGDHSRAPARGAARAGGRHRRPDAAQGSALRRGRAPARQRGARQAAVGERRGGVARRGPRASWCACFQAAEREASALKDEFISTEHLLLALAELAGRGARRS